MSTHHMTIYNLRDLCFFFGVDEPYQLNRALYKATECGATISLRTPSGQWFHNGETWGTIREIDRFTIQTIVEGSDATVGSDEFILPVKGEDVDAWIEDMETQAAEAWEEANNPMCHCGHRSDDHDWIPDPRFNPKMGAVTGGQCKAKDCNCTKLEEI